VADERSDEILQFAAARALDESRQALECAFYRKEDEGLRTRLHEERERREAREALGREAGLSDPALVDRLVALGIRADTVEALVLVPLVEVAWADGTMDPREREAVLRAAASVGIAQGSPSYDLLDGWTQKRPAPELLESWRSYIRTLGRELSADHRWHLEEQVMGKARAVAEAAGGFLGLAKVSRAEEAVLADLEAAFRS
jgi:tellurite resistance protein